MTSRLSPRYDGTRVVLTILFVVWGLGGFILAVIAVASSNAIAGAVMATAGGILWIGGMVFFGMAALLASPSFIMTDVARFGTYKGYKYKLMVNGTVQVDAADGPRVFDHLPAFKKAVKEAKRAAKADVADDGG